MDRAFAASLSLEGHPLLSAKKITKIEYYNALRYFVFHQQSNAFVNARLDEFRRRLNIESFQNEDLESTKSVNSIVNTRFRPWRNKYKFWLLCDVALILLDDQLIVSAKDEIDTFISQNQRNQLNNLLNILFGNNKDSSAFQTAAPLIKQYHMNRRHINLLCKKYVVTANMSAGKSTFINALIGKPIARTSEEACTGNINYFYNKPFEDETVHFYSNNILDLHAEDQVLSVFSWEKEAYFASFFRFLDNKESRICIIDTPGVNSAINMRHGSISKGVLQEECFDKVIYLLNASKLGTDEELAYVRWISEHVPHDKVIFVLNKLDNFKNGKDDISASINGVRDDLLQFFDNPVICPLSARFALLLKMKSYGERLSLDEADEYEYYAKKFKKPTYDLSKYYTCTYPDSKDESILLSQKCGMYGLEKILMGGNI